MKKKAEDPTCRRGVREGGHEQGDSDHTSVQRLSFWGMTIDSTRVARLLFSSSPSPLSLPDSLPFCGNENLIAGTLCLRSTRSKEEIDNGETVRNCSREDAHGTLGHGKTGPTGHLDTYRKSGKSDKSAVRNCGSRMKKKNRLVAVGLEIQ